MATKRAHGAAVSEATIERALGWCWMPGRPVGPEAQLRAWWPARRRAIWLTTRRRWVPVPAERFDGLALTSLYVMLQTHLAPVPLAQRQGPCAALTAAVAADLRHLTAFRQTEGGAGIGDCLTVLEADLEALGVAATLAAAEPVLPGRPDAVARWEAATEGLYREAL